MLHSRWISLLEYDIIGDAIRENFQNASCTPIEFFVEEYLGNWHPKTHVPRENDRVREEENFQAAESESSIPSDHNSDSESSGTSSEPASSHP